MADRKEVERLMIAAAKEEWADKILWRNFSAYDRYDRVVFGNKAKFEHYYEYAKEADPEHFNFRMLCFPALPALTIGIAALTDWIHPVVTFVPYGAKGTIGMRIGDTRYEMRRFMNCYVKDEQHTVALAVQTEIRAMYEGEVLETWYPEMFILENKASPIVYPDPFVGLARVLSRAYLTAQYGLLYRPEVMVESSNELDSGSDSGESLKPFRKVKAERHVYDFLPEFPEKHKYTRRTGKWWSSGYVNKHGTWVPGHLKGPHRNDPNYPCAPPKEFVIPGT